MNVEGWALDERSMITFWRWFDGATALCREIFEAWLQLIDEAFVTAFASAMLVVIAFGALV